VPAARFIGRDEKVTPVSVTYPNITDELVVTILHLMGSENVSKGIIVSGNPTLVLCGSPFTRNLAYRDAAVPDPEMYIV
jgi:hypothetical protein